MKAIITILILIVTGISIRAQQLPVTFTYSFNTESRSSNYLSNLLTTAQQKARVPKQSFFKFSGILQLHFSRQEQPGDLYAAKIIPFIYGDNGNMDAGSYQPDTFLLSQPFFFYINRGSIGKIFLHKKTPETVLNSITSLLSQLQYSLPRENVAEWTVVQDDPSGHCETVYSLAGFSGALDSIVKVKKKYVAFKQEIDINRLKTTYLPEGNTLITLDKGKQFPISIYSNERLETQLSGKIIGELETTFRLQPASDKQIPTITITDANKKGIFKRKLYKEVSIYSFISSQQFSILVRKSILGNDNARSILAKLKRPVAQQDEDSLYLKIKSLATVYPETVAQLVAILDISKENTTVYQLIYRGLLGAENKESVNALAMLAWKHRDNWEYSKKIISNLGLTLVITDSLITIFKKLAMLNNSSRISKTAQMALGTMVDNFQVTDSAGSAGLWQWLAAEIMKMGFDQRATRQKLLIWGNTNARPAFDSVIKYLHNGDEAIRGIATLATGQFSFREKVPALLEVVRTDTLLSIKNSAAVSIAGMVTNKEDIDKAVLILETEKDTAVRNLIINSFDPATKEKKMLQTILKKIMQQDDCRTVRTNVEALLSKMDEKEE